MILPEPCPKCGYVETSIDDDSFPVCQQCHESFGVDSGHVLKGETDNTLYIICPNCECTIVTLSPTLTWRECAKCGEVFAAFDYAISQDWINDD